MCLSVPHVRCRDGDSQEAIAPFQLDIHKSSCAMQPEPRNTLSLMHPLPPSSMFNPYM